MSRKILKGSNSSESDPPSCTGFSLASWPRSFMASSKRDRYFWRPGRGELLRSSDIRSPLGLCRIPPMSSSRDPPWGSLKPGRDDALFSGVALWERLPCPEASGRKGDGRREDEDDDNGSVLSRSRWKCGSVGRRHTPAAAGKQHHYKYIYVLNSKNKKKWFGNWEICFEQPVTVILTVFPLSFML